jgi:DNA-binding NtrC family response regulator/pSer/pThr/pTyr-binding forkhead associated (FHA) protein
MARDEFDPDAQLALVVLAPGGVEEHALPWPDACVIGRAPPADVCIDDASVSRAHARLARGSAGAWILDLGSRNGTFVNDERVGPEGAPVAAGDVLRFGAIAAQIVPRSKGPEESRVVATGELDARLEAEVRRCLIEGRPLALIAMEFAAAPSGTLHVLRRGLLGHLWSTDVAAVRAPGRADALLCDRSKLEALDIAERIQGDLARAGIDARVGVAALPDDTTSAEGLVVAVQHAIAVARAGVGVADAVVVRRLGDREILVADPAMVQMLRSAERVAALPMPLLVLGEVGSGKETLCEAVHALGPRAEMPLVKVDCAAIPEDRLEDELFGLDLGASSGAPKPGSIELAHGGTLLLDEVGDVPLPLQAKLLSVLEKGRIQRLGAPADRPVDVRFIAATHRDLHAAVEAGRFRKDLYFRLATLVMKIPPLRARPREILLLAQRFAAEAAAPLGRAVPAFTDAAIRALTAYPWPGNIRELRNVIQRAMAHGEGDTLDVVELGPVASAAGDPGRAPRGGGPIGPTKPLDEELRDIERSRILEALDACGGNETKAADLLRMPRGTLVARMAALGIQGKRGRLSRP